jgi:hypothetical protein
MAIVFDSTGNQWLAESTTSGLSMYLNSNQIIGQTFDGGNPVNIAATTCSVGICLAWTDATGNVWVGALDTTSDALTGTQVFDAATYGAVSGFVPSIASVAGGGIVAAWQPNQPSATSASLFAVQLPSPTAPAPAAPMQLGPSQGPPLVLPWRGGAVVISAVVPSGFGQSIQAFTLGVNPTGDFVSPGITCEEQPSGYVDGQGNLVVAFLDNARAIDVYLLPH